MKTRRQLRRTLALILSLGTITLTAQTYPIVDTGQTTCYNNSTPITAPPQGQSFYGQDAQYSGNQPAYTINGDGTVTDNVTGLMWTQSYDLNGDGVIDYEDKLYADEAIGAATACRVGGYADWRLPTIKELYSLILFSGNDLNPTATTPGGAEPFIDADVFEIGYGDLDAGDRIIDAQVATCTYYGSTTMGGNTTMFGVNFVDGRIKGYPASYDIGKKYYVLYVRNNPDYGKNNFIDNGDGTITDTATGLMWAQDDNGNGIDWQTALSYAENSSLAGYSDWRLPNAKELQSIIDYTRSPDITHSPAIDPLFHCTSITNEAGQTDYPFYWTGTTHCGLSASQGTEACYVSFGRAMGYMSQFGGWVDVHGAGAQRSDPKAGDSSDYPYGHGPQGDAIRINNFVRLVRNAGTTQVEDGASSSERPEGFSLEQNYPNPFNPTTTIAFSLDETAPVRLRLLDIRGRQVQTLVDATLQMGTHEVLLDGEGLCSGTYFYSLQTEGKSWTRSCVLQK